MQPGALVQGNCFVLRTRLARGVTYLYPQFGVQPPLISVALQDDRTGLLLHNCLYSHLQKVGAGLSGRRIAAMAT